MKDSKLSVVRDKKMKFIHYQQLLFVGIILSGALAQAATIEMDSVIVRPGDIVEVPVYISSATAISGINLCVGFAPDIFSSPEVVRNGALLEGEHHLNSYSPEPSLLAVQAYAQGGMPPFKALSGKVFSLSFLVSATASYGSYSISFATSDIALLAPSGLSDPEGNSIDHTSSPGMVVVQQTIPPTATPTLTNTPTLTETPTPTRTQTPPLTPTNAVPMVQLEVNPQQGAAPLAVALIGKATDSDGLLVQYGWAFHEAQVVEATGSIASATVEAATSRIYLEAGQYRVVFRVWDDRGAVSGATEEIHVWTPIPTHTPTMTTTATWTNSPTFTATPTATSTPINTPTFTLTNTPTITATPSVTVTPTKTPTPRIILSLFPESVVLPVEKKIDFRATITGTSNTRAVWFVNEIYGGNSEVGSVSQGGQYTAPEWVPEPPTVVLKAISQAYETKFDTAAITIIPLVSVSPAKADLVPGGTCQLEQSIFGIPETEVRWCVNDVEGGNESMGTITGNGLYTAPSHLPFSAPIKVEIKAICVSHPDACGTAILTLQPPLHLFILDGHGRVYPKN